MKRKHSWFIGLFVIVGWIYIHSQTPKSFAKVIIEKLTSDEMAGRGYSEDGMMKAADFIENEFKRNQLLPISGTYRQSFTYPIRYLKDAKLVLDGKELRYGYDYILDPASMNYKGKINPVYFQPAAIDSIYENDDLETLGKQLENLNAHKTIVFPHKNFPENYVVDGFTANQLYDEIRDDLLYGKMMNNFEVIINVSDKNLVHSLSTPDKALPRVGVRMKETLDTGNFKEGYLEAVYESENQFKAYNVFGMIKGKKVPDSLIVITAHYDHLGKVGKTIYRGANDNASGVALMIALSRYFSKKQPDYSMVFIAFAGEEAGLRGSQYFVENSPIDLKKIKLLLNFDMVGTGEEGITVVNAKKYEDYYYDLAEINLQKSLLKQVKARGESCNSDHCPFYNKGVPSLFIYTLGGSPAYHHPDDHPNQLSLAKFDEIITLFINFIEKLFNEKND